MKKHYAILFIIGVIGITFLALEDRLVYPYSPSAIFLPEEMLAEELTVPHIAIQFDYTRQPVLGSNQIAIWITDAEGHLVNTLAVTQYTATGGWRLRKTALPDWVRAAGLEAMGAEEVDSISAATPRENKTYGVLWDFTDEHGNRVANGTYYCFVEGTLYFNESVLYSYVLQVGEEIGIAQLEPAYTKEKSNYKQMLSGVHVAYLDGQEESDEN